MPNQSPKCFVCGPLGVGKTSILSAVNRQRPDLKVIPDVNALMDYLGVNHDSSHELHGDQALDILGQVRRGLLVEHADEKIIQEGHLLYLFRGQTVDIMNPAVYLFDVLVFMNTDPYTGFNRCSEHDRHAFNLGADAQMQFECYANYLTAYRKKFHHVARTHANIDQNRAVYAIEIDNSHSVEEAAKLFLEAYDAFFPGALP